jgi:hypothetical protein
LKSVEVAAAGYTSHFKPISRAASERLASEYDGRVEIAAQ